MGLLQKEQENPDLNWTLAQACLEQIHVLLTSADAIKKRYGLDVSEESLSEFATNELPPPPGGLAGFMAKLKQKIHTAARQLIQSRNGPGKRLRWAAVGRQQAEKVIRDISQWNDRLDLLLDSADRERRRFEDDALLKGLISLTTTTVEVTLCRDSCVRVQGIWHIDGRSRGSCAP